MDKKICKLLDGWKICKLLDGWKICKLTNELWTFCFPAKCICSLENKEWRIMKICHGWFIYYITFSRLILHVCTCAWFTRLY